MYFQLNNYAKGNPSMIPNEHNTKKNICGKQIYLIRTGQYDKKHKRITQDLLAARLQIAGLDIDRTAISKIESGIRSLTDDEVLFFAEVLEVPVEVLYNLSQFLTNDK